MTSQAFLQGIEHSSRFLKMTFQEFQLHVLWASAQLLHHVLRCTTCYIALKCTETAAALYTFGSKGRFERCELSCKPNGIQAKCRAERFFIMILGHPVPEYQKSSSAKTNLLLSTLVKAQTTHFSVFLGAYAAMKHAANPMFAAPTCVCRSCP